MSRYDKEPEESFNAEQFIGFIVATELRSCGVDLSFTPELDLDYGVSSRIGTRAFHREPEIVTRLAESLIHGLNQAGMGACGKNFPGHGAVQADSPVAVPVDERDIRALIEEDLAPYRFLGGTLMSAIMPAHVIYPEDRKSDV